MEKAGISNQKHPSAGDLKKMLHDAPPGDKDFVVGDRVHSPRGIDGTVKEIYFDGGKLELLPISNQ